eukprot:1779410-Prymnesium_polylepis.1
MKRVDGPIEVMAVARTAVKRLFSAIAIREDELFAQCSVHASLTSLKLLPVPAARATCLFPGYM